MVKEEARNRMIRQLKVFKDAGLNVYINRFDRLTDSHYGIISDGKNIVYIQFAEYGADTLFLMFFEYIPSIEYGSGVSFWDEGKAELTVEDFKACVAYGKKKAAEYGAELYRSLDHYMGDPWHKKIFEKL